MAGRTATIQLAPRLGSAEAAALRDQLAEHAGSGLAVDAAAVTQLGAQCIQVLAAARISWATAGIGFELRNLAPEIRDSLGHLGLAPGQIGAKEGDHDA